MAALFLLSAVRATAVEWESYPGFTETGHADIVVGDFNGDSMLETAVSGHSAPNFPYPTTHLIALLGNRSGHLGVESITTLPGQTIGKMVVAPEGGTGDRLAVVTDQGDGLGQHLVVLGGTPLRVLRTTSIADVESFVAIADVDADGDLEIVATTPKYYNRFVTILDYQTGIPEWTDPVGGATDGAVTQLDGDPALELILAGDPGRIIDGATRNTDWVYPGGFNGKVLAGRFSNEPSAETFAVITNSLVQVFRSEPFSPIWEFEAFNNGTVAIANPTADGLDQIAAASAGQFRIYDPRDGHVTFEMDNVWPTAMAFDDVDADGHTEIVFAGISYIETDRLKVVDLTTMTTEFERPDEIGPFSALVRGDIDGNGPEQVAYIGAGMDLNHIGWQLHVVDAANGEPLRTRADVFADPWADSRTSDIALAQLDTDPQREIVVSGTNQYYGEIAVLDGTTLADQWRVGGFGSPLQGEVAPTIDLVDQNGDGVQDIIAATSEARVLVLDGRNGDVLWQSVALNGSSSPHVASILVDVEIPHVLLTLDNGIYLFDLATGLLDQTEKVASDIVGLWQWGNDAGCRFATLDESSIVTVHRCAGLEKIGAYPVPENTTFFRPIYDGAPRFLVASGSRLYVSEADGSTIPVSRELGQQLGMGNNGVLQQGSDADHFDLVIGSDYMVTRLSISTTDVVFTDGFE